VTQPPDPALVVVCRTSGITNLVTMSNLHVSNNLMYLDFVTSRAQEEQADPNLPHFPHTPTVLSSVLDNVSASTRIHTHQQASTSAAQLVFIRHLDQIAQG